MAAKPCLNELKDANYKKVRLSLSVQSNCSRPAQVGRDRKFASRSFSINWTITGTVS